MTLPSKQSKRNAVIALVVATFFWGCGFTWAKHAGEVVNELTGAGAGAVIGPVWVLTIRFFAAGVLWLIMFRSARRGWSWDLVYRSFILGLTLTLGMVVQHLGLDRTTEATSAFLTSLTILFVPLMMTLILRKPPPAAVWIGVVLAAAGVWILTGGADARVGLGEALGIGCAVAYSINIIAINKFVTADNVMPITAGQFLVLALLCFLICLIVPHGLATLMPAESIRMLKHPAVSINVALMTVFVSMCAFGLQFRFQPRIDPTRAALLYLFEPIFAALYAWIAIGRTMTRNAIVGAALILVANAVVELLQSRRTRATSVAVVD